MEAINLKPDAKILVTRLDRIGDFVLSTPVFEALRKRYPSAHITAMTFIENQDLIKGNPYINDFVLYDKKGRERGWLGNWLFARRLAKRKFDIAIHLHSMNRAHLVSFLAGIPIRLGWTRKASWALTHGFEDVKSEGLKHESEYNFDLLKPLGVICPDNPRPFFYLQPEAEQSLNQLLRQRGIEGSFMVLNPTASCPSKMWPPYRFADLATELWQTYRQTIVITGSAADGPVAQKIKAASSAPIVDLTGQLTLSMLGCLMKKSSLLISNDTGPVHIASAVGTPVVSIFGRNQPGLSPTRWKPLGENVRVVWKDVGCNPCLAHNCHISFLCLDVITVEDVLREAESLMQEGALR